MAYNYKYDNWQNPIDDAFQATDVDINSYNATIGILGNQSNGIDYGVEDLHEFVVGQGEGDVILNSGHDNIVDSLNSEYDSTVKEAPSDDKIYGRQNKTWVESNNDRHEVLNKSGSNLAAGAAVKVLNINADPIHIDVAVVGDLIHGFLTEDIDSNQTGIGVVNGKIYMNTNSWTTGDILYHNDLYDRGDGYYLNIDNVISATKKVRTGEVIKKSGNGIVYTYAYASSVHDHTESEIVDLDKYTQQEVDDKLSTKADLNESGYVKSSQLPSYVDDVREGYYDGSDFYEDAGYTTLLSDAAESDKIYTDLATNDIYRWAASVYVKISDVLSAEEIKQLYESNADTNAYTDNEKTKLADIETYATKEHFRQMAEDYEAHFYIDMIETDVYDGKEVHVTMPSTFTPTTQNLMFSIDNTVNYYSVYTTQGDPLTFTGTPLEGTRYDIYFSSGLDGWVVLAGDLSTDVTRGPGWAGESVTGNAQVNEVQNVRLDNLEEAITSEGYLTNREIRNETPTVITDADGPVIYEFPVTYKETNDSDVISVGTNNRHVLEVDTATESSGYTIIGEFDLENTNFPQASSIECRLYGATTGLIDTLYASVPAGVRVTGVAYIDYTPPTTPEELWCEIEVTSREFTIHEGHLSATSKFSTAPEIALETTKVLLDDPANESVSGTDTTQAEANVGFVDELALKAPLADPDFTGDIGLTGENPNMLIRDTVRTWDISNMVFQWQDINYSSTGRIGPANGDFVIDADVNDRIIFTAPNWGQDTIVVQGNGATHIMQHEGNIGSTGYTGAGTRYLQENGTWSDVPEQGLVESDDAVITGDWEFTQDTLFSAGLSVWETTPEITLKDTDDTDGAAFARINFDSSDLPNASLALEGTEFKIKAFNSVDRITMRIDNLDVYEFTKIEAEFSAPLDMGGNKITTLATPTADADASTKKYVDDGLALKSDDGHQHTKSDITDFAHTHTESDITDLGNYTEYDQVEDISEDWTFSSNRLHVSNASDNSISPEIIITDTDDVIGSAFGRLQFFGTDGAGGAVALEGTEFKLKASGAVGTIALRVNNVDRFQVTETGINSTEPLDMNSNKITEVLDPTADQDAATKKYVDDAVGGQGLLATDNAVITGQWTFEDYTVFKEYIAIEEDTPEIIFKDLNGADGTCVGRIKFLNSSNLAQSSIEQNYTELRLNASNAVDTITMRINNVSKYKFSSTEALFNSPLNMNSSKVTNLAEPTVTTDATTKNYVDTALNGKSDTGHQHTESDITDLGNYSTVGHGHTESDITDLDKYTQAEVNTLVSNVGNALDAHEADLANPHSVTKSQVSLGNADNTSDADKPVSTATQSALNGKSDTGHGHTESDITDLGNYTDASVDETISGSWSFSDITNFTSNIYVYNFMSIEGPGPSMLLKDDNSTGNGGYISFKDSSNATVASIVTSGDVTLYAGSGSTGTISLKSEASIDPVYETGNEVQYTLLHENNWTQYIDVYTTTEVDNLLIGKSDTGHGHTNYVLDTGDSMTGNLEMGRNNFRNVARITGYDGDGTNFPSIYFETNTGGDLILRGGSGGEISLRLGGTINSGVEIRQAGIDHYKPTNMNSYAITNLPEPTADQDAATKKYVDDNAGGGGVDLGTANTWTALQTFDAGMKLNDSDKITFGTGNDVDFYANGSHMYTDLQSGIGNWYIRDGTTTRYTFDDNGQFTATSEVRAPKLEVSTDTDTYLSSAGVYDDGARCYSANNPPPGGGGGGDWTYVGQYTSGVTGTGGTVQAVLINTWNSASSGRNMIFYQVIMNSISSSDLAQIWTVPLSSIGLPTTTSGTATESMDALDSSVNRRPSLVGISSGVNFAANNQYVGYQDGGFNGSSVSYKGTYIY